jgi:ABC-type transporter Mla MlaB component
MKTCWVSGVRNRNGACHTFAEFRRGGRCGTYAVSMLGFGVEVASIDMEGNFNMIRIQNANNPGGINIAIDGQLVADYIQEVETSIRNAIEQHKHVHLFLRDVSHIDEPGHSLLSRLAAQGVELSAAGLYSSYVVSEIQRALSSRQNRHSEK